MVKQKSISASLMAWMHHLASWSQKIMCQWWSGSDVKKVDGLEKGQFCQNGQCMPFNHWALDALIYLASSQEPTFSSMA
jgi:hypothetical protein